MVDGVAKVKEGQQVCKPPATGKSTKVKMLHHQPPLNNKSKADSAKAEQKSYFTSLRGRLHGSIFIHRPIFAWVIALVIMLAGILTLHKNACCNNIQQLHPTVTISATYPWGICFKTGNTVTQIIEQQMNGLDGLRYISSNSAGNGHGID